MTQYESARTGVVTEEMKFVAAREDLAPELIRDEVARGRMVIPANVEHLRKRLEPMGIGVAGWLTVGRAIIDWPSRVPAVMSGGAILILMLIPSVRRIAVEGLGLARSKLENLPTSSPCPAIRSKT